MSESICSTSVDDLVERTHNARLISSAEATERELRTIINDASCFVNDPNARKLVFAIIQVAFACSMPHLIEELGRVGFSVKIAHNNGRS